MRALEKEGWLKVLHPHWSVAKIEASDLGHVIKQRQMMNDLGYSVETGPIVMYFLTRRMSDKDIAEIQRMIPRRDFVDKWKHLESGAHDLAKKLTGKEASTPSGAWKILSSAAPENILFLSVTTKQQAVDQKLKNFFSKWRQVREKLPFPEMAEMRITPQLPEYPEDPGRSIPAAAGWQAALAQRDHQLPEAVRAAAAAATAGAQARTRQSGCCCAAAPGAEAAPAPAKRGRKPKGAGAPVAPRRPPPVVPAPAPRRSLLAVRQEACRACRGAEEDCSARPGKVCAEESRSRQVSRRSSQAGAEKGSEEEACGKESLPPRSLPAKKARPRRSVAEARLRLVRC